MKHWTLDDIAWGEFDPSKVTPGVLMLAKAASVVEYNGGDYAKYLCNVFHDDPGFQREAKDWAEEEVQHGRALGRWAEMADPNFSFEQSFAQFMDGFQVPVEQAESVRGSRSGELVARCIVETGTSSYYTALADTTEEPVLREICRRIAADEHRHYKLFYGYMKRYLEQEKVSRFRRVIIGISRITETEDDELAYACYATADGPKEATYDRKHWNHAYMTEAYGLYRRRHLRRAVGMILKAIGLRTKGWLPERATDLFYGIVRFRHRRLAAENS